MEPSSASLPSRTVGRYVLFDSLAAGGMATVHIARLVGPVGFSRTVAIKRLHDQYAADADFVSGFLDEARLAARIRHPNVVPTLDVVAMEGQLFVVMEYVQGESLSRLIRAANTKKQKVPVPVAVGIVAAVLHGLHAAHEAKNEKGEALNIVHRDVSPQNVLVGADGVPRVLDFGVAKATGRLQTTRDGQLKGKVAYMSPEQLRSETVDRRTDIFAASIVLWEALTQKRLFTGENEGAVLTNLLFGTIEPPSKVNPGVPAGLDAIVMRGLEREVAKRYQTAREMALDLEKFQPAMASQIASWVDGLAHEVLAERAARVAEIESASSNPSNDASAMLSEIRANSSGSLPATTDVATISQSSISVAAPTLQPPNKRGRWAVLAGALAVFVVAVVGLAIYLGSRGQPTPAAHDSIASASPSATVAAPVVTTPSASAAAVESAAAVPTPSASAARPALTPTHTATATVKKPKVDCTEPFKRDELGRKIYKPECLE